MAASPELSMSDASLLEGSIDTSMTPERCDLDYWIHTAMAEQVGLAYGVSEPARIPSAVSEPGPLREAIVEEFAFRAASEEAATRSITYMVRCAPTLDAMDFYATQLLDEARHALVFRHHLIDLGVPRARVARAIEEIVGSKRRDILEPLEAFGREVGEARDFVGCVVVLAVIAEGALAPAAEMSERKWRLFDPAAAEICRGANLDEIRHLSVGTMIVREHLRRRPDERPRLQALIARGMKLWGELPISSMLVTREKLFQQGIELHGDVLGDYELTPGCRLAETTIEQRLALQVAWSLELREQRLAFMGLDPPRG